MSKMDDLRAMREARFQESADVTQAPESPGEGLCGHRAISGRTCTRDQGHREKSHRYA